MELNVEDTYRVKCVSGLSADGLSSLAQLYLPLIKADGLALYMALFAESRGNALAYGHRRLLSLLGCTLMDLEKARNRLEEYLLLKTYERQGQYVYVLKMPLSTEAFLQSASFYGLYQKEVGEKEACATEMMYADAVSLSGYREVTHPVVYRGTMPVERPLTKPNYVFRAEPDTVAFDYEHFFAITTALVFPIALRTRENLYQIGRLATVYGISAERMHLLVGKAVDLAKQSLNLEKLKMLCAKENPSTEITGDIYAMSPLSFLQSRMHGANVPYVDRKLLEHLAMDMHFSNEVINVMVEYILKVSDNKLVSSFVDMVAGEWAREGISDRKAAQKKAAKGLKKTARGRMDVLPAYLQKKEAKSVKQVSVTERKQLQKALQETGEEIWSR